MKYILLILLLSLSLLEASFQDGIDQATYYQTPQGHALRYSHFKCVEPRGTVVFIQGRGTFLEFYEVLITPLLERGFDVWMYDLSGQGGSDRLLNKERHDEETVRLLQHVDSFDTYINDATAFIQEVVLPQAEGELILGGYSTGGHLALRLLQSNHPFEKAFIFSPMLALPLPLPNAMMSRLFWAASECFDMETYRPGAGPIDPIYTTLFEENGYTSDPDNYLDIQQFCIEHSSLMMGGVSLGWVKAAVDSLQELWKEENIKNIDIPIFIATGGSDTVVDVTYNHDFVKQLPHGTHVYYPQGRHEIFREAPDIHETLWDDFDLFFSNTRLI